MKGREVHCINSPVHPELNQLLGNKWNERILNKNGDFSFVTKGTIQFWTHNRNSIKEFVDIGGHLFENQIENDSVLIFTFVRGDGVQNDYKGGQWKYWNNTNHSLQYRVDGLETHFNFNFNASH